MRVQLIAAGLQPEEIVERLRQGWVVLPGVTIKGPAVVTPNTPPDMVGQKKMDIWFLPEPMVPTGIVAAAIVALSRQGGDIVTLNDLAKVLFGQTLGTLEAALVQLQQPPTETPVGEEPEEEPPADKEPGEEFSDAPPIVD